jgi:thiol-disulfide isomerase/thioredoxin
MPMFMGYDFWNLDGKPLVVQSERQLTVTLAVKDSVLPDSMFEMPMRDGVQVDDWSRDPPLIYKSKHDMTAAEWNAVLADADKRKAQETARLAAQNSVVGRQAPAFGATKWLNSKPLTWADLKGKYVIVDFWAEWCAPCRNWMAFSQQIHDEQANNGINVIGIHPTGSKQSAITKFMKEYNITYPVCIDVRAPRTPAAWGLLYSQYKVTGIPDSVLVDPSGKVIAHGTLAEMLNAATTAQTQAAGSHK